MARIVDDPLTALRTAAAEALDQLASMARTETIDKARVLVNELRKAREFVLMRQLAEAVSRHIPYDATSRRLYAQSLIETGMATVAVDVLTALTRRLRKDDPEWAEAKGLLGRAYKQLFFDAADKTANSAIEALKQSIAAYRDPYKENSAANYWHGVNLVALLTRARRLGLRVARGLDPTEIATDVVATLGAKPTNERLSWEHASLAEAKLALDKWDEVEADLRAYVTAGDVNGFNLASTLRQFTEVWDLEASGARGRGLVDILRAQLMRLPGGTLEVNPADVTRLGSASTPPSKGQLEAILGIEGPVTFQWWVTGLQRARAVGVVRQKLGQRIGTCFLVRAGDFGLAPADALLALTNFHVVNPFGAAPGAAPGAVELVFEAADPKQAYEVDSIVWSSPAERHDATILRFKKAPVDIEPLPIATAVPLLEDKPRVYIIGYPGGRDLAFSFQDNELLDHEGPPTGKPPLAAVCKVHYRAPTEGGSSGSPVFNADLWEVVALHHFGGSIGVNRLNGIAGTYAANEGIWIQSISKAIAER